MDDYCQCQVTTPFSEKCENCKPLLEKEDKVWTTIYEIMDRYKQKDILESQTLLFGYPELDDIFEVLFAKGDFIDPQPDKNRKSIHEENISE